MVYEDDNIAEANEDESVTPEEISTSSSEETTTETTKQEPKVSIEYQNALTKAQTYSDMMKMSKKGLYDQLTSEYGEQFPADAAQYAIDHVDADWNANALAKAKDYQETMAMSTEAIRDQLTSEYGEQFTPEEAEYAIQHLND